MANEGIYIPHLCGKIYSQQVGKGLIRTQVCENPKLDFDIWPLHLKQIKE